MDEGQDGVNAVVGGAEVVGARSDDQRFTNTFARRKEAFPSVWGCFSADHTAGLYFQSLSGQRDVMC